jgi:GNAT superfamily N-acetyltransferase
MSTVSIRQLVSEDWAEYRDIRLEALAKVPGYFCPSRDEFKFEPSDWINRLSDKNAASFGLFVGQKLIGITGIVMDRQSPDSRCAFLVSSYIKEEHRRQGFSKQLFDARIAWARGRGNINTLLLEHRDDNFAAHRSHQKYGFEFLKSYLEEWPDGQTRLCLVYQLRL